MLHELSAQPRAPGAAGDPPAARVSRPTGRRRPSWRTGRVGPIIALLVLACAPLPGPRDAVAQSPEAELARLRQAQEAAQRDEPARALEQLDYESSSVPDHVAAMRARLLQQSGDTDAALAAAEEALALGPPPELRALLLRQIAQIELERDRLGAAYASARLAWEASLDPTEAGETAFRFAKELENRGLPGEAMLLYRSLWERWPASEHSLGAFEASERIRTYMGGGRPELGDLFSAGETLRDRYRCREAEPFFEAVLAREGRSPEQDTRARRGLADCAFQRRRYPEARSRYQQLVRESPDDHQSAIQAARARGRAGDASGAVEELEAIAQSAPAHLQPRVLQLIAILVSDDDPEREGELLRKIVEQGGEPGADWGARWSLAWLDLRVRKYHSALRWLEPIRGSKWDIEVQRARYWTAIANQALDPELGEQQLRALVEEIPLTYYGLLAAERLGVPAEVERSFLEPREAGASRPPAVRRASLLIDAGWDELARVELLSWVRGSTLDREERMLAASLLQRLDRYHDGVQLVVGGFGGHLDEGVDPLWREAWHLAWPRAFGEPVRQATREFDFDPALVYAIMREESLYRPRVESAAGARGLMQLIPPTAERIASQLSIPDFGSDQLYEPETNVRFGTYYLKQLVEQFGGSHPHAIAAYNAGPDAVRRWMEQYGDQRDDQFVDSVPYGETRRYLRRVLRSYRVYQMLYAAQSDVGDSAEAEAQAQPAGR